MTTPTPDDPTPDEPASELTPEASERLRARLAAPAPPAGVLEAARSAAMAAYDEVHATSSAANAATVHELGSRRDRRAAWYQRVPLGAAAAVLAVVAAVGVVTQIDLDGGEDADTASAELDSSDDAGDAAAEESLDEALGADSGFLGGNESTGSGSGGDGTAAADGAESAPLAAPAVYDDLDDLVEDYRRRFVPADDAPGEPATTSASRASDFDGVSTCDAAAAAGVDGDDVRTRERVSVTVDGERITALVLVYESDPSGSRIAVVDEDSCVVLVDRAL